jgi:ABC-type nitrate/sulfonate/bicarbonate transport system permease component
MIRPVLPVLIAVGFAVGLLAGGAIGVYLGHVARAEAEARPVFVDGEPRPAAPERPLLPIAFR